MDLRLHPCSVAPAECHEKCGPCRPTRSGYSCNNATQDYDVRWGVTTGAWTTDMFVEAVYETLDPVN